MTPTWRGLNIAAIVGKHQNRRQKLRCLCRNQDMMRRWSVCCELATRFQRLARSQTGCPTRPNCPCSSAACSWFLGSRGKLYEMPGSHYRSLNRKIQRCYFR
uniref:E3 ubiquitin-protein ligase SIAH1B n=1 Tax=Phallusia mammillata TaxID=59560 RepID=A0A6F9DST3_9ASCI|nr:E3 ubiquitin-protein ligase SIAH1B [Phallusia mammillata]